MTQTLRRQLEEIRAQSAEEPPALLARMAHGEALELVVEHARARHPGVAFGLALITRVWGAPVREPFAQAQGHAEHPSAKN